MREATPRWGHCHACAATDWQVADAARDGWMHCSRQALQLTRLRVLTCWRPQPHVVALVETPPRPPQAAGDGEAAVSGGAAAQRLTHCSWRPGRECFHSWHPCREQLRFEMQGVDRFAAAQPPLLLVQSWSVQCVARLLSLEERVKRFQWLQTCAHPQAVPCHGRRRPTHAASPTSHQSQRRTLSHPNPCPPPPRPLQRHPHFPRVARRHQCQPVFWSPRRHLLPRPAHLAGHLARLHWMSMSLARPQTPRQPLQTPRRQLSVNEQRFVPAH